MGLPASRSGAGSGSGTGMAALRAPAVLLVVVLGGAASAIGVTAVSAWYLGWTAALHTKSASWPITFNTALGLTLSGAAVAGMALGQRRTPLIAGCYDLMVGALTLMEYLTGRDLGIDQLFVRAYVSPSGAPPGRMAVNSAVCWVVIGAGIVASAPWRPRRRSLPLSLSGAVVAGLASVALFGHVVDVPNAYDWGPVKGMALPTACGLVLLGLAALVLGWVDAPDEATRMQWWAFPAGLLTLVFDVFLWETFAGGSGQGGTYRAAEPIRATTLMGLLLATVLAVAVWLGLRVVVSARALQESEARYRGMMLSLGEGVVVQGADGRVIDCNEAAERILGVDHDVMMGVVPPVGPRWQTLHEDGSPFPDEDLPTRVTLRTGEPCRSVVMRVRAGQCHDRWIIVNSEPVSRPGESWPYAAAVSFADITDIQRARREFQALAENSPDFIVRFDSDARLLYVNPALARVYGVPDEQLIGHVMGEPGDGGDAMAFDPDSVALLWQKIHEVFERGTTSEFEITYRPHGGRQTAHYRLVPERDEEGRVTDVLAVGRDLTELKRLERELAERESRYRDVFDNSPDSMFLLEVTPDGRQFRNLEVNPALERSTGIPREAMVGRLQEEVVPPEVAEAVNERYRLCVEAGVSIHYDVALDVPSGRRWYHTTLVPARDATGRVYRIIGISSDITAERALAASEERFRLAFEDALVGMALLAVDGVPRFRHLRVNPALCNLLGRQEKDLLGLRQADVMWPDDATVAVAAFEDVLSGTLSSYRAEHRFRTVAGGTVWGLLGATLVRDGDAAPLYVLCQVEDVTARKLAEEQLLHRALHDDLTGLPNRALLLEHLTGALARSGRTGSTVGVLYIDLDGFKSINDDLGHAAGDELLRQVAARISAGVRASDVAARVGGDEFVVICENLSLAGDAAVVAEQVQRELGRDITLRGRPVTASASIGIATSHAGSTPDALLRDADAAMYAAKKGGGSRWEPADASVHAAARRTLTVEAELRRALERDELRVYYQPVIDLRSGQIVAAEALVRWQHPQRGLVLPGEFVDVAEQRGLICDLGAWVLRTACGRAAAWRELYGDGAPCLAVNVSSHQLVDHGLSDRVGEALDASALPPDQLVLEVAEGQLLAAGGSSTAALSALSEVGVRIAVDDVGTCYSGLEQLRRLPLDELKIDRSFIDGVGEDRTHTAITAGVVALGLGLGLTVVAEGVETPGQFQTLLRIGCSWGQGWLWHPALPAEEIDLLLAARPSRAATPET